MSAKDDLEMVANYYRNLPDVRGEAIEAARAEGVKWREIAAILEMTENGVHKAYQTYQARKAK
jgi:DNA-directed RNA polymerase specialized sigma24 family protein